MRLLVGDGDIGAEERHRALKTGRADVMELENGRLEPKGAVAAAQVAHDVPPFVLGRGMSGLIGRQVDERRFRGRSGGHFDADDAADEECRYRCESQNMTAQ
jgi:hypothetical protein